MNIQLNIMDGLIHEINKMAERNEVLVEEGRRLIAIQRMADPFPQSPSRHESRVVPYMTEEI
jgi:hypothetical protein